MNISVVIVTYNSMKWIEKCIDSIIKSTIDVTIIIIDNKSTDETVSFLESQYQNQIILIQAPENLGFGKGNNLGIKKAIELNSDYVFLLNQDTIIEPILLEKLLDVAKKNPEYGIISPVHLDYEGNKLEYYFSHFMVESEAPFFISDHIKNTKIKSVYETNFVNAAAWLLSKKVLENIGGFDPMFWHYGEDDNYAQRVKYHGYKIGVVPGVFVYHDSKERVMPKDYLFSEKYYLTYEKGLMVRYGDINSNFTKKNYKEQRNIIFYNVLINLLNFKFVTAKKHYKKLSILRSAIKKIEKSRTLNKDLSLRFKYVK